MIYKVLLNFLNVLTCMAFIDVSSLEKHFLEGAGSSEVSNDKNTPMLRVTFPGTKWCGPGNSASEYEDLGEEVETDKCCREHDHCPESIGSAETRYNLTNDYFFTRSHCYCDKKLYDCLKNVGTKTSNSVGNIYFDLPKQSGKCFKSSYPIKECKAYHSTCKERCVLYAFDKSQEVLYQWFDLPVFENC